MYRNLSTDGLGISGVQSEIIELAVSYKFSGLSTNMLDFYQRAEANSVQYAHRLFESAKLTIGYFDLPVNWQDSEEVYLKDLARLDKIAAVAAEVGATRAVTVLHPYSDERPYHENFEFQRKRLSEIGEVLTRHGLKLGLQFQAPANLRKDRAFEYIHTADELLKLISAISQPCIGVVLDNWQWYVSGSSNDLWKGLSADQIVTVQLSGCTAGKSLEELEDSDRLLPNETEALDSGEVIKHLASIGYNGPVTLTPHKACFSKAGRLQIVKTLGQSCMQLWVDAGLITSEETTLSAPTPVAAEEIEIPEDLLGEDTTEDIKGEDVEKTEGAVS